MPSIDLFLVYYSTFIKSNFDREEISFIFHFAQRVPLNEIWPKRYENHFDRNLSKAMLLHWSYRKKFTPVPEKTIWGENDTFSFMTCPLGSTFPRFLIQISIRYFRTRQHFSNHKKWIKLHFKHTWRKIADSNVNCKEECLNVRIWLYDKKL